MSKTVKQTLSVLLCVTLLFSMAPITVTHATDPTSGTCGDNLTWKYDTATATLTISGTGAMTDYNQSYYNGHSMTTAPWKTYYQTMKTVVINGGVTSIGDYAFYCCTGLTSVTIGNNVTSIGDWAFYYCTGLTSVTIPNSVVSIGISAFNFCTGLTSVTIPNSVVSIGISAFNFCTGLTSVTIPNSVTSIDYYAFAYCTGLTAITVNTGNLNYSSDSFGVLYNKNKTKLIQYPIGNTRPSFTVPNSVTCIGDDAFRDCIGLTSVTIPNSVTSIDEYAFDGCTGLTSVTIGNSVTSIGEWAFSDCTGLTSVTIPDSVTSIGNSAFYDCTGLTSVTIPDSVTSIDEYAFDGCTGLTDVYYSGSAEQWSKISIGSNNNPLLNATIHYNSTGFGDDPISEEYGLNIIINNQTLAYRTNEIIIIGVSYYQDDKESVPDDIQVKVSDSKVLSVSSIFDLDDIPLDALKIFVPEVIETYNKYKFIMLNAKEAGSFSVTISCSNNEMITRTIPFVISEDKVATLRATEVTTHEYSLLGERDYYNSFHNGIWVSDFSYKSATNEAGEKGWKFSMNIYNENYSCGVVEVYDADGKIYDIKEIKKFETLGKGLYKTLKSGFTLIQDIAEGDVLSFRSDTTAKHTPINDLFVPQDGYLVVTSSCITSVHCAVINAVDMLFTAWKLAKDTKEIVTGIDNLDTDAVEQIKLKMIAKLLCSEEYLNAGKKLQKKFVEKGLQNLTVDGINAIAGGLTTDVDTFLKDMGLSLDSLLKLTFNTGVGIAEDVLERCMQGYGLLLKSMFAFVDYTDFLSQAHDVTKCCTKDAQFGCYTPNPNYPKGIISNEDVKVKTNNNVPTSSVLESYRIYNADRVDFYVSNIDTSNDYEMYEISLRNNGELVQPSGDVTVSIVCPYKKAVVVRLNSDGSWELLDSTIDKGVITFNVDHFCRFAIISKDNDTPPAQPKVRSVSLGDVTVNYKAKASLKQQITADDGANYTVSYSSSNPNVVKVNEKTGEITGAKKGTATITCTVTDETGNTVTDTCKVTVKYTAWQWVIIILLFGWLWY